jgi:hypothetical protein
MWCCRSTRRRSASRSRGRDPALGQSRHPHRRLWLGGAARAPLRRQHADGGACAAGALSTLGYGLLSGFVLLFVARLMWGGAVWA